MQMEGRSGHARFDEETVSIADFWEREIAFVSFYRYLIVIGRRSDEQAYL
jgi:hypothetical protein